MVGLVAEPFMRSLRLLKYARIRLPIVEVRTKRHYELEAIKLDNNGEYSGKLVARNIDNSVEKEISKEVEIVNRNGNPLGEFDEIDLINGIFYEDKTAKGLNILNPKTGLPAQTVEQFTDKQIYQKTAKRIENLKEAEATRITANGSQIIPSINEIKKIKKFVFRLDGNSPELQKAAYQSIKKLQKEFPDYSFKIEFGGK